ncbi:MAG: hypothetical protein Fur0044_40450 [Anaerolineae bacterium]
MGQLVYLAQPGLADVSQGFGSGFERAKAFIIFDQDFARQIQSKKRLSNEALYLKLREKNVSSSRLVKVLYT